MRSATTGAVVSAQQLKRHTRRSAWTAALAVVTAWAVWRAGVDEAIFSSGWSQIRGFFAAAVQPDLSSQFLRLTFDEALVTIWYAILGTSLSVALGLVGGLLTAETTWQPVAGKSSGLFRWLPVLLRTLAAIPRGLHEVVFALLLVNVLGLNPFVAILAIGIPFGAVTARIFAEIIDETSQATDRQLRAAGSGRLTAIAYGVLPRAMPDMLSYGFYRLECAVRAAAVLGIVGAGGLGFQLRLSFQSLRYDQMWTLLYALAIIGAAVDRWSSIVRLRRGNTSATSAEGSSTSELPGRDGVLLASAAAVAGLIPIAWLRLDLDIRTLFDSRARRLAGELSRDMFPPEFAGALRDAAADSIAMASLAIVLIAIPALLAALIIARPEEQAGPAQRIGQLSVRTILLMLRVIPPPVWALLALFALQPGIWPGAVALALYNLGVLGRLQAEVIEGHDNGPGKVLAAAGANKSQMIAYSTLPATAGRFLALGLYRWEVALRDTVMVGAVGAAGFGRLIDEQSSSFDHGGLGGTLLTLIAASIFVERVGAAARRSLRA